MMRRFIYLTTLILAVLLLLNFVTWFFFGMPQMLRLAEKGFDAGGALSSDDTLYVYAHYDNSLSLVEPGEFSPSDRERLFNALVRRGKAGHVVYNDATFPPPGEPSINHLTLYAGVLSYPFYARVHAAVLDSGFAANRVQR